VTVMPDRPRAFPPSLHPLSVLDGIAASAKRTPARLAIVDGQGSLTYAALAEAVAANAEERTRTGGPRPGMDPASARSLSMPADRATLVALLAAARIGAVLDLTTGTHVAATTHPRSEDDPFVIVDDGTGQPLALSHRTLIVRALNAAVMHAAFSRDTISATPLPLATAAGTVAAIAPLWLGGTVHFVDAAGIVERIVRGEINQAWFGPSAADLPMLEVIPPPAPPEFRLAILTARPSPAAWARWIAWLGEDRVAVETIDPHVGPLHRLRGRDLAAEPHIGVMLDASSGMASGLATSPATPAWRSVRIDNPA